MTKEAVVKGFARWYGKRILPAIRPKTAQKVFQTAAIAMAEISANAAVTMLPRFLPGNMADLVPQFLSCVENDEIFNATVDSMRFALKEEPMEFFVNDGVMMRRFELDKEEFNNIIAEMNAADVKYDSAAQNQMSEQTIKSNPHPAVQNNGGVQ